MHDLTGFQRDLLLVIGGLNEPKGLDVNENIEEYYGSEIRHGRLYPNLDALVDKGLVKKDKHDLRTNKYTLTDRGTREITARLEWELSYIPEDIKSEVDNTTPEAQSP